MGSWANSLHVRHSDAATVAAAIREILRERGYLPDPSHAEPAVVSDPSPRVAPGRGPARLRENVPGDRDDWWDEEEDAGIDDAGPDTGDPGPRRLNVYQAIQNWVGILDSGGIAGVSELAGELSGRLRTDALLVLVNDSDSWYYQLHRQGRPLDEFDSSGETGDDSQISPEIQAALERGDEKTAEDLMLREVMAHAPRGPIWLPFGRVAPPPELGLLGERLRAGKATLGERLRFAWLWLKFQFHRLTAPLRPGRMGFDVPRATPLDGEALRRHVARIREVFPAADARALRRLLPVSRFPAEALLAEFLRTVGLPALYADLSYDYLEDFTEDELAAVSIRRAAEVRLLGHE